MSRTDKPIKTSTTSQLKKDLSQAGKALRDLTNSLERVETTLASAETALASEISLKEELLLSQKKVSELQQAYNKIQKEHEGQIISFADTTLKLTREFQDRSIQLQLECDSKLRESQRHYEATESTWKRNFEKEKAETYHLKENEINCRKETESQLQKAKEAWQKKEGQLLADIQQRESQNFELSKQNKALTEEVSDQETMLKGRDKEIQKLGGRLAALEAFSPQELTDRVSDMIAKIQTSLREFCLWCVESAESLPGWNRFPEGLRYEHLPRFHLSDSASGRYILIAALQHSICATMMQNFLPPFGPYTDRGMWDVSEALFRNNQSHEAIWRLMTVNIFLSDQKIMEKYKANLREVAKSLLLSWKPIPGDVHKETLDRLTRLLIDSAVMSLELLKFRKRIYASVDVVGQYFDSDSEEDSYNIPGGFQLPDSTAVVLCLFPAFFWNASPTATPRPSLLRKGTAMFRDSPPLLVALNDEQEAKSPNMGSKRRPTN